MGRFHLAGGSETRSDALAKSCVGFFRDVPKRKVVISVEAFGGVGDGTTSNTEAFWRAILHTQSFVNTGGSQLNVRKGRWLMGSFNLTSNFTLFLEQGVVIGDSQAKISLKKVPRSST
ncbi:hypothetical protein TB2_000088 [Malus domestica]